jgi:hypothetical protein
VREALSKALLARVSAFAKPKLLSPLLPAMLALFAKIKVLRDTHSEALLARVSALAKAKRLSPIMLASLALLATTTALSAFFLLAALIGWGDPEAATIADWRPPAVSLSASSPSAASAVDTQTLSRPVFAKSRRPSLQPAASTVSNLGSGPQPMLGVEAIVFSSGGPRAYLVSQGAASGDWYVVGQLADGWTVAEIRPSELVLKSGERSATLSLYPETTAPDETEMKSPENILAPPQPEKPAKAAGPPPRGWEGRR